MSLTIDSDQNENEESRSKLSAYTNNDTSSISNEADLLAELVPEVSVEITQDTEVDSLESNQAVSKEIAVSSKNRTQIIFKKAVDEDTIENSKEAIHVSKEAAHVSKEATQVSNRLVSKEAIMVSKNVALVPKDATQVSKEAALVCQEAAQVCEENTPILTDTSEVVSQVSKEAAQVYKEAAQVYEEVTQDYKTAQISKNCTHPVSKKPRKKETGASNNNSGVETAE